MVYYYASRAVCAYTLDFRKLPGFAPIGACALISMNTVYTNKFIIKYSKSAITLYCFIDRSVTSDHSACINEQKYV